MVVACTHVVVAAVALLAASANAHSKMSLPKPMWIYEDGTNSPAGTVDSSNVLPVPAGMGYEGDPLSNTEAYWTAFNASKYTSLKELVFKNEVVNTDSLYGTATIECGYSWTNGTARDLPDEVQWDKLTTGHDGPCEIWCDDTLVFSDQNCAVNYPDSPASFPYDKAACEGKSMLTAIWLALHSPPWQVFTNCAPLKGVTSTTSDSTSSASSSTTTTTQTTDAPTATTAAPTAATTPVSSAASSDESSAAGEIEAVSEDGSTAADYDTDSAASAGVTTTTTTTAPSPAATTGDEASSAVTTTTTSASTAADASFTSDYAVSEDASASLETSSADTTTASSCTTAAPTASGSTTATTGESDTPMPASTTAAPSATTAT